LRLILRVRNIRNDTPSELFVFHPKKKIYTMAGDNGKASRKRKKRLIGVQYRNQIFICAK